MNTSQGKRVIKIFHLRSSGGFYGAEAVILNASRELNQMGCANHICCINNLKNPHAELVDVALKIGIAASSVDSIALLDWEAVKEIRQLVIDGGFHILHCHDYKASIYGLLASKGMTIRRVVTNHLWDAVNWKLWLYQRIEGFSYNLFDRVVAVSEMVKKDIRPYIIHKSKIEVIENGIDVSAFGRNAYGLSHIVQNNKPSAISDKQPNKRSEFGLKENDFVIGIVGRLARQKGHEYLLKAFARLLEKTQGHPTQTESLYGTYPGNSQRISQDKDTRTQDEQHVSCPPKGRGLALRADDMCHVSTKRLRLLVVGDGKLELPLKALCNELGLDFQDFRDSAPDSVLSSSVSVIFTGPQSDMQAVYQAIDLLVMPSLSEGLPMALLEAMASGVPVVATPVGQIPNIIKDGETGWIVRPKNVDDLTSAIEKIILGLKRNAHGQQGSCHRPSAISYEQIKTIKINARKLVEEQYSSRAMAKKYLEVYEWLAE